MNADSLPIKPSVPLERPGSSRARRRASLGGPRNDTEISTQQNNLEFVDLSGTRKDKFQLNGKLSDTQRESLTTLQRLLRPKTPMQHQNEPIVKVDSVTLPFPNTDRNQTSNLYLQNWIEKVTKSHQIPIGSPAKVDKVKIESLMEEWPPEVAKEIETLVAKIDFSDVNMQLSELAELCCNLLGIHIKPPTSTHPDASIIEAVSTLFLLYAEFNNSEHFGKRKQK